MDNVATFERILGHVRQWRKYEQDEELVDTMKDAIRKTKQQIAEIRKEQRVQFEAYLAINEMVSGSGLPTIPEEQEVSFETGGMVGKGKEREELRPFTEKADELSHNRTTTLYDADKTSQMDEEQADRQCEGRIEVGASQAPLQLEAWSLDEMPAELGPAAYMNAWKSTAVINELLRENVEKQRGMLAGLKRCKEEIVKMQEEMEKDGILDEEILQRWTVDVETFLRERDTNLA